MTSANSQTRSSIDLGVESISPIKSKSAGNHPPRLQHSPSLPNIWFPPHSGPIPPQFEDVSREALRRPSTPPYPVINLSPEKFPADPSIGTSHAEHLQQTQPLKIMRRRVDRDQGRGLSLLTPPLTPSSSLKTATSTDSNALSINSEISPEIRGDEADTRSTRFLLLGNVSRQVDHDVLRTSIVESLTSAHVDAANCNHNHSVPDCSTRDGLLTEDSIKGIFLRCQQASGIVILAFFDVRHAKIAKTIISVPALSSLSHCAGDDLADDGTRAWITCQFISADELVEVIGSSAFLTSTDASFYLAVEAKKVTCRDIGSELRVHSLGGVDDADKSIIAAGDEDTPLAIDLNIVMLERFLKSFGDLRMFYSTTELDMEKQQPHETIFHVEYYDVREAISAYTAVDGQVLFGMKLRVFGRDDLADAKNKFQEHPFVQDVAAQLGENDIPFPTSTEHHSQATPKFGYPGQYSHTRERFFGEGPQTRTPYSNIQVQEAFPNSATRSPVPSPTYFYTSDPSVSTTSPSINPVDRPRTEQHPFYSSPSPPNGRPWIWDARAQCNTTPGLYVHPDCYYCPSRGSPTANSLGSCYVPCSTPSPYCYQSDQRAQTQNRSYPPPHVYGYQYDASYPQPLTPTLSSNTANLAFEHAMMTPQGCDPWFHEPTALARPDMQNIVYCSSQPPVAGASPVPYATFDKCDPRILPDAAADIYRPNFPPFEQSHTRAARPTAPLNSGREPRPSAEHNQLNLSRIEDGQDTRTTVMIKNIPNKMSDKDLVAFIGKVCPRQIDFLYLRMDFQNGCNVGYAFVNFITVQDLLCFAKKKLGEKWNMFSSEKVLQMSYANYQGKEALVEKFKNSCIMDEQEAWRPKIFYSDPGPEQGLPEPFPAPTHIRRKERSAFNRGALYVPGVSRGSFNPQSIAQTRRLEDTRKHTDRCGQVNSSTCSPLGNQRRRPNAKLWGGSQHE